MLWWCIFFVDLLQHCTVTKYVFAWCEGMLCGLFQLDEACWVEAAEKNKRRSAVKATGLRNQQDAFPVQAYHCRTIRIPAVQSSCPCWKTLHAWSPNVPGLLFIMLLIIILISPRLPYSVLLTNMEHDWSSHPPPPIPPPPTTSPLYLPTSWMG